MHFDYRHQAADAVHLRMQAYRTPSNYSPDGSWVSYESKDSEDTSRLDYDIYRVKADSTGAIVRQTNDLTMEFDPAWRPIVTP